MLDQIKDKINRIDKVYIIGAVVVGISIAGAVIYFRNRKTSTPEPQLNLPVPDQDSSLEAEKIEEKAFLKVINGLKKVISHEGGGLNYESVKAIFKAQYQLSESQFKAFVNKFRSQRRAKINDIKQYYEIVTRYSKQLDKIHDKHLHAILTHFKISESEWVEVTDQAGIEYPDEWNEYLAKNDQDELDALRNKEKPKIKLPTLIDIVKLKIEKLTPKVEEFKTLLASSDQNDLYFVVEKWSADMVWEQFKVDEEDFNYSQKELTEQERERLEQYEAKFDQIMEKVIGVESDDQESS